MNSIRFFRALALLGMCSLQAWSMGVAFAGMSQPHVIGGNLDAANWFPQVVYLEVKTREEHRFGSATIVDGKLISAAHAFVDFPRTCDFFDGTLTVTAKNYVDGNGTPIESTTTIFTLGIRDAADLLRESIPAKFFEDCRKFAKQKIPEVSDSDVIAVPLKRLLKFAKGRPNTRWIQDLPRLSVAETASGKGQEEPLLEKNEQIWIVGYGPFAAEYDGNGNPSEFLFTGRNMAPAKILRSSEKVILWKALNLPWLEAFSQLNSKQSDDVAQLLAQDGGSGSVANGDSGGAIFKIGKNGPEFAGVIVGGSATAAIPKRVPVNDEVALRDVPEEVLYLTSAAIPVSSPGFQKLLKKK
jgi:hypothetical protein